MATTTPAGYTIGPYELRAQIGQGRHARVYRALHADGGQEVAFKAFFPHLTSHSEFQSYFQPLLESTSALAHPHILPVLDYGVYENLYYVVMPFLRRRSLHTLLRRTGSLDADHALVILEQAGAALDEAHAQGIVHGSVHPRNLLVDDDGTIRLADFGHAGMFPRRLETPRRELILIGPVEYMGPEQALDGIVTPASDRYSLGMTLYQMLAGGLPHVGDTPLETIWMHARSPVPQISLVRPELPASFDAVIDRALARRPEDRPESAAQMAAELSAALVAAELPSYVPPIPPGDESGRSLVGLLNPRTRLLKGMPRHLTALSPQVPFSTSESLVAGIPSWALVVSAVLAVLALFGLLTFASRAVLSTRRQIGPVVPTSGPSVIAIPTHIVPQGLLLSETPIDWPTLVDTPTTRPTRTPWPSYTVPPVVTATSGATSGPVTPGTPRPSATQPPAPLPTQGAVFTLGIILPQTPRAQPAPLRSSQSAILFIRDGQVYLIDLYGGGLSPLTSGPGRQFRPSSAGQIAFASDRDGDQEIYVVSASGAQTRLTSNSASDSEPSWSWDGEMIAFTSTRTGGSDIYTMRADGGGVVRITDDAAQDRWPTWSPAGDRLAFASNRDGGDFDLYVASADGSGVSALTSNRTDDTAPVWSPDGGRIAYVSGGDVWVLDLATHASTQLTRLGGVQAVTWSPDCRQLAFSSGGDLWVIGAGGGAPLRLTSGPGQDTDPAWVR